MVGGMSFVRESKPRVYCNGKDYPVSDTRYQCLSRGNWGFIRPLVNLSRTALSRCARKLHLTIKMPAVSSI